MVSFTTIIATLVVAACASAKGINCQGSGLCVGNKGLLGQAQGQLRGMGQNRKLRDGEHAVCVKSSVSIGDPSLCIFYQNTGREWTVGQTVGFVQNIIDHGCAACGSVPVDPGNDVKNGQLTANMVTNAAKRGNNDDDDAYQYPGPRRGVRAEVLAERALGINCRGSSTCSVGGVGGSPAGTLEKVRDAVAAGPEGEWSNGQQIACVGHVTGRLCCFYQNIGTRRFSKGQTLNYLAGLAGHGCRVCGSIPTDDGNNGANGELTVNFVA
ncbi:hypothetical protein V2A60_007638 [Cordyceps javanica]|uniref:Killer toxin, Kp4 n=1 Tax=Cordyceps javanica TaxID=43265 RepID=A0A545VA97_9HYPO|nr:Killer toxin, Kp4 [Cordyceps javanica]TQW09862.1 Killer toxin, Kp4 [Cordyceps javanica]